MSIKGTERLARAFAEIQQTARVQVVDESQELPHRQEYDRKDLAVEVWNKEEEVKALAYEFEQNGSLVVPPAFADFLVNKTDERIKISGEITEEELTGKDGKPILFEFSVGGLLSGRKHGIRNTNFVALMRKTAEVRDVIFVDETGKYLKIWEPSEAFSPVAKATTEELDNAKLALGFIQRKLVAAIAASPQSQL